MKKGDFHVVVTSAGELRAKKFVQVQGPLNMQQADIYQTKISSLVPEGTVVKEGDVVAELDRSGIAAKMAEVSLALQKAEAQLTQAQLDSTLNLSTAREEMKTMELSLEEKRLAKEQAVYESPSVKRQVEIDYEKATRALAQAKTNYKTKTQQAVAKMAEVGADVQRQRNKLKSVQEVLGNFTIKAPSPGHGDLREGVERQEEGHRLAGQCLGSHRRDAAGPRPDGIAHLRERDRRPEDRVGPEGDRLARLRSDEEAARDGRRASRTSASSGLTRTRRCSR